jgi:predicted enzyme related to lactoylglutathione lyase
MLYPSWIEIPVIDLARATAFYGAVFGLPEVEIHSFSEQDQVLKAAVLSASDKPAQAPGVSLVQSSRHQPSAGGVQVNFHIGDHAALARALAIVTEQGGAVVSAVVDAGEGVRYAVIQDTEGNRIALSGYDTISVLNAEAS